MAKQKRKVTMPAGIRNKMMAAVSMLMVSCIMMVSSTYAWFTLSTAPEVKNISTTVAGNGSLEIALMPESGLFSGIGTGSGTSMDGSVGVVAANTTWGNLVTLSGGTDDTDYYGINKVTLLPAALDIATNPSSPLKIAVFGSDGRVADLTANTKLMTYEGGFIDTTTAAPAYGVRAIAEDATTTYGYVVDFAVRINTAKADGEKANLKLQTQAVQRVYSEGTNPNTLGGGSVMRLSALAEELSSQYVKELLDSIRITFVANYGKVLSANEQITVLGEARLDTSGLTAITQNSEIPLYLYKTAGGSGTGTETVSAQKDTTGVLVPALEKNKATQISAIVWLDGANIKNASLAASTLNSMQGTLNLQFSTDASLVPANNTGLMNSTGAASGTTTTTSDTPDLNQEPNGEDIPTN